MRLTQTCARSREAVVGNDVFLGLSAPNILTPEMLKTMAPDPIVMALANPTPEIDPALAVETRSDAIVATGRSDFPNQVNNVLCYPFIFRGALDAGATTINEAMKVACVEAIANVARRTSTHEVASVYKDEDLRFGRDYLIPQTVRCKTVRRRVFGGGESGNGFRRRLPTHR